MLSAPQLAALPPRTGPDRSRAQQRGAVAGAVTAGAGQQQQPLRSIQQLIQAIPTATDQKGILDLQARIGAEQGMLQNEQTKLQTLYQAALAQARCCNNSEREQAIAAYGSFGDAFRTLRLLTQDARLHMGFFQTFWSLAELSSSTSYIADNTARVAAALEPASCRMATGLRDGLGLSASDRSHRGARSRHGIARIVRSRSCSGWRLHLWLYNDADRRHLLSCAGAAGERVVGSRAIRSTIRRCDLDAGRRRGRTRSGT